MRVLIFDNYDSFTYNLVQLVEQCGKADVVVKKNDQVTLHDVEQFNGIVFSPGPGLPHDVPLMMEIIRHVGETVPVLGVCLGHQAIAEAFGGTLKHLHTIYHGTTIRTKVFVPDVLFRHIPDIFDAGLYHSWAVDEIGLPDELEITARGESGNIMAIRHRVWPVRGIQFHPESIMTPHGQQMIENWLSDCQAYVKNS